MLLGVELHPAFEKLIAVLLAAHAAAFLLWLYLVLRGGQRARKAAGKQQ
jgi:hypothetical protein